MTLLWGISSQAQNHTFEPEENRLNSNLAIGVGAPLSGTAKYAAVGIGIDYGVGYNFNRHNSLIGEFMWNDLRPTNQALAPIRMALNVPNLSGNGNFVGLMANYRRKLQGRVFGTYLIAGGGIFYRNVSLSQPVTVGKSETCDPAWLWWGFTCSTGAVTGNQTVGSSSSTAPGADVGIGFTVRLPDTECKFYMEARYYYAGNKYVSTQLLPINIGLRF